MADEQATVQPDLEKAEKKPKQVKGVVFTIVNAFALILIPAVAVGALVLMVLLRPEFYAGILKNGGFITAFVEAKNWQTDQAINDEIERDLNLTQFTAEFKEIKARYEQAEQAYTKISRDAELESLKKQRADVKDIEWKQVANIFPTKDELESYREAELARLGGQITGIKAYRDAHGDEIKTARKEIKKARGEYEDARSVLEDKKADAEKIVEKHADTASNSIYGDLEIIEKPLTNLFNEKLIDGAVRDEIEKMLKFFTSYNTQAERGAVFYERPVSERAIGSPSLSVRLPAVRVSLWVDDDGRQKHVLSQLLVEGIDRLYNLRNKALLKTMFRLSDSSLGEYFGGRYLSKFGFSIDGGFITRPAEVLEGPAGEYAALAMQILTVGKYAVFGAAGLLLLYIAYLFFSAVERRRKLSALKRLFIYPSLLILAACGSLLWASRYLFDCYPEIIENLTVRSFAKHLSFTAAWHLSVPVIIVFGSLFVAGLFIRKFLTRSAGRHGSASQTS
ncbi:MAG: hypothetical protein A2176_04875 [Spirochaetes bacterium RBG_13_51_14]|nr:MAG: hypothetical protein A2176_04875 [Spirochaetes bacterium RBG_13_51_14]